jgi:hypothetical protein
MSSARRSVTRTSVAADGAGGFSPRSDGAGDAWWRAAGAKGGPTVGLEITEAHDRLLTVRVTGTLTRPELARAQASALEVIRRHGAVRILVIVTDFLGWNRADDWGDVSFAAEHDPHIEKIALVGEKRWEELALAFTGKGFRQVAIEYFVPTDLARARAWVASTA